MKPPQCEAVLATYLKAESAFEDHHCYVAKQKGFKSTLVRYAELKVFWKGGKEGWHVARPGPFSCFHKRQNHSSVSFLQVPRLLNVILGNSPYFELISPSDEDYKVAPGMSSTYRILFRPDENKDYFDELIIITEREKFFVPIRAIGARASLDFPEQLNFSNCPVRFSTQKTLLVRNVGNREACYSITTLSPFSVDPSIGTLGVGEAMQVTVEFHPPKTGVYSSPMIVHYDTVPGKAFEVETLFL
ncbi:hydrocephalus-inducing protein homolog [Pezoporus flaviventris]|uniref:hydrocephalus-inducing protein homolog n=1 Tax=Pezoporus flaviventris TaxID=889875 RepID=UPI002AB25AAF|nr:hydrocephalus-inducing protein homolog [Pezoporus flaviventris]